MANLSILIAIAIGAAFASQPGINAVSASALGSWIPATALSVAITFLIAVMLMFATGATPDAESFSAMPWWVVMGGVVGFLVVGGGVFLAPILGVTVLFVCLIAGQLIGSVAIDYFGAFGLEARAISPTRALGVFLAFVGVILVRLG